MARPWIKEYHINNTIMYEYGNISIIEKQVKKHRKRHLLYIYIIYKGRGGLWSSVSNG
jgi:hypothetical protein